MIAAGLGLMFGMGGGILASINLSRGKLVVANINVTQSIVMLTIVSIIMGILLTVFPETVVTLLGAEGHLTELSAEYLFGSLYPFRPRSCWWHCRSLYA